jgi:ketosteroid isomerase-like protein
MPSGSVEVRRFHRTEGLVTMGVVMETGAGHLDEIEAFFADFENASDTEDWARYGDMFLEQFLNLDPASAGTVARDDLIAFLPRRRAVFERAGATGTRLTDLRVERLDDIHVLARTTWDVVFDHEHASVQLRSTYVLRHEDRWRIAMYLNHGSLLELLGLTTPA